MLMSRSVSVYTMGARREGRGLAEGNEEGGGEADVLDL